jgi:hypothetical protein
MGINVIERNGSNCKYVEIFTHRVGSIGSPSRRTNNNNNNNNNYNNKLGALLRIFKPRALWCARHGNRMIPLIICRAIYLQYIRVHYKTVVGKQLGNLLLERPRRQVQDNIKMDLTDACFKVAWDIRSRSYSTRLLFPYTLVNQCRKLFIQSHNSEE